MLRFVTVALVASALAGTGCSEVRGRRLIQEGNQHYKDGNHAQAVEAFTQAEAFLPDFWVLWLNKGYTCRQMLVPGAKTPENKLAADCATAAFKRLQELKPDDPRGEVLYVQTLFDADEFETLAQMFQERLRKNPRDIDSITGLVQVYSKSNQVQEALEWYAKKAEVQANDAEAQYGVGVFIWQQLSSKGGGPEFASHDPRPDPNNPRIRKMPPLNGVADIVSQQRVDMADMGIKYLERALELRTKYHEAMTYMNLLYRQKSYAFFSDPAEWQKSVDKAEEWRKKSLEAQGKPVVAAAGAPKVEAESEAKDDEDAVAPAAVKPEKKVVGKKSRANKKKPARKNKRAGRK